MSKIRTARSFEIVDVEPYSATMSYGTTRVARVHGRIGGLDARSTLRARVVVTSSESSSRAVLEELRLSGWVEILSMHPSGWLQHVNPNTDIDGPQLADAVLDEITGQLFERGLAILGLTVS